MLKIRFYANEKSSWHDFFFDFLCACEKKKKKQSWTFWMTNRFGCINVIAVIKLICYVVFLINNFTSSLKIDSYLFNLKNIYVCVCVEIESILTYCIKASYLKINIHL